MRKRTLRLDPNATRCSESLKVPALSSPVLQLDLKSLVIVKNS